MCVYYLTINICPFNFQPCLTLATRSCCVVYGHFVGMERIFPSGRPGNCDDWGKDSFINIQSWRGKELVFRILPNNVKVFFAWCFSFGVRGTWENGKYFSASHCKCLVQYVYCFMWVRNIMILLIWSTQAYKKCGMNKDYMVDLLYNGFYCFEADPPEYRLQNLKR